MQRTCQLDFHNLITRIVYILHEEDEQAPEVQDHTLNFWLEELVPGEEAMEMYGPGEDQSPAYKPSRK